MMRRAGWIFFGVAILFLFYALFGFSCTLKDLMTGVDKGAKGYTLVADNKELLLTVIEDMQEVQKAFRMYEEDRTLFTEKALKDELDDLYNSSLKLREFLKDLDKILKQQE